LEGVAGEAEAVRDAVVVVVVDEVAAEAAEVEVVAVADLPEIGRILYSKIVVFSPVWKNFKLCPFLFVSFFVYWLIKYFF
jgi:hypothetical protein